MISGTQFDSQNSHKVPQLRIGGDRSNQSSANNSVLGKYQSNIGLNNNYRQAGVRQESAGRLTEHTLVNMTKGRYEPSIENVTDQHLAKYKLSMKSSVSKANGGKIQHLGTFKERAQAIQNKNQSQKHILNQQQNDSSNFDNMTGTTDYASNFHQQNQYYDSQKPLSMMQKRGHSHLQIRDNNMVIYSTNSNIQTGSGVNSGLSSHNIRSSKYNQQNGSIKNLLQAQARKRSGLNHQRVASSLQKLQVVSDNPNSSTTFPNKMPLHPNKTVIDYSTAFPGTFENDTKEILSKHAANAFSRSTKQTTKNNSSNKKQHQRRNSQVQVLYSSDTQDERVRLIVVQSSFAEVIAAMHSNERSHDSQTPADKQLPLQRSQKSDAGTENQYGSVNAAPGHDSTYLNETTNPAQETSGRGDTTPQHNLQPKQFNQMKDTTTEEKASLDDKSPELKPKKSGDEDVQGIAEKVDSVLNETSNREIKMMDTITFVNGFQPVQWIFTDLLGKIQSKEISQITVNEVIKAFLINLNQNKKTDFNNDDLMQFLDKEQIDQKICFAIKGQKRELLDIKDLLDLNKKFPKGIDALQLFKIPTRSFIPFYFHHILSFDQLGRPLRSTLLRLPMTEVQAQMDAAHLQSLLGVLREKQQSVQQSIQRVSNDVVSRLTEIRPVVLLNIVIVYLLEEDDFEPWFIGTEKCEVLTQKITQKKNKGKRRYFEIRNRTEGDIFSQIQENYENLSTQKQQMTQESATNPGVDSPTRVQVMTSDMQSQPSMQSRPQRGGRASSTTTVFQKLDSRSHITSQKNAPNEEGESDHYMMMLSGNDETVQALLLNKERQSSNLHPEFKSDVDLKGIQSAELTVMSAQPNQSATNRAYTQSQNIVRDQYGAQVGYHTNSASLLRKPLSSSNALGELETPIGDYDQKEREGKSHNTSFFQHQQDNTTEMQYKSAEQKNYRDTESGSRTVLQKGQSINSALNKDQNVNPERSFTIRKNSQAETNIAGIQSMESAIIKAADPSFDGKADDGLSQILFQSDAVNESGAYIQMPYQAKQRGKSANVYQKKNQKQSSQNSAFQQSGKTPLNLYRHQSSVFGMQGAQKQQKQQQPVFLLQSNELLTENELFSGLAKIGSEYGKAKFQSNQSPLYNKRAPSQQTSKQQISKQPRAQTAGRIQAFISRQEQLKQQSEENKAQRMVPKAQDNRLLSLFPQFLDKVASKNHSKFLFGDSEQAKVFRNYKNAMLSFEMKAKNLGECMLPQNYLKDEVKMYMLARENETGKKIFDMKMSDEDEAQFIYNTFDQTYMGQAQDQTNLYENTRQYAQNETYVSEFDGTQQQVQEQKNLDLKSLDQSVLGKSDNTVLNSHLAYLEQGIDSGPEITQIYSNEEQASFMNVKKDFLSETLMESRKIFKVQSQKQQMSSILDQDAMSMINAQRDLEGVVVSDPEKILNDFRNNHNIQAMDQDVYNLNGQVPRVASELAERYVEIRETMRRRKQLEESQRQMNALVNQNNRSTRGQKKFTFFNRQPQQNKQQRNLSQRKNLQQIQKINDSRQALPNLIKIQSPMAMSPTPNLQEMVVIASEICPENTQLNQEIELGSQQTDLRPAAGSQKSQEVIIHANVEGISRPRSIDTIDHVHSQHLQSAQNQLGSINHDVKCELGLCCDNSNIMLSPEMQVQDVCYIQQQELKRAKNYLVEQNRTNEIILRYSQQLNFVSRSQQQLPTINSIPNDKDMARELALMSQISENQNPLLEPSVREVAVGGSSQALLEAKSSLDTRIQSFEALMAKENIHVIGSVLKDSETGSADEPENDRRSNSLRVQDNYQINAVQMQATRNEQKATRYQTLTQRLLEETYSTLPLPPQRQISTQKEGDQSSEANDSKKESQREYIELLGLKGIQVVKRMTDAVLQDYGGGMFSNEYEQVVNVGSNSTSLHPKSSDPNSRQVVSQHEDSNTAKDQQLIIQNSSAEHNEVASDQKPDSQLSQLGIRHVKLDQENWVPSPELVPCCVRCFSIATYVLNYQLDDQA